MKKKLSIFKAILFNLFINMSNYILLYYLERSLPPDTFNFDLVWKVIFTVVNILTVISVLLIIYGTDEKNNGELDPKISEYEEKQEMKEEKNDR